MKKLCFLTIRLTLLALVFAGPLFCQTPGATKPTEPAVARTSRIFALRLNPGHDLRQPIKPFVNAPQIRTDFIITTVGSLRHAAIRLADQSSPAQFDGKFEIVSLVGTLGQDGVHLHIAISDSTGKTIGGHLENTG
jgi:predicted DNA-binding protein with PD1-like motif